MKYKLNDRVKSAYTNMIGYIDAITDDKYRIRTSEGYEWIFHFAALPPDAPDQGPIVKG